jgi:hypothetical protein
MVQYVNGGERVGSVQRWKGKRSMKSGMRVSGQQLIQQDGSQGHFGLLGFDTEDDELVRL